MPLSAPGLLQLLSSYCPRKTPAQDVNWQKKTRPIKPVTAGFRPKGPKMKTIEEFQLYATPAGPRVPVKIRMRSPPLVFYRRVVSPGAPIPARALFRHVRACSPTRRGPSSPMPPPGRRNWPGLRAANLPSRSTRPTIGQRPWSDPSNPARAARAWAMDTELNASPRGRGHHQLPWPTGAPGGNGFGLHICQWQLREHGSRKRRPPTIFPAVSVFSRSDTTSTVSLLRVRRRAVRGSFEPLAPHPPPPPEVADDKVVVLVPWGGRAKLSWESSRPTSFNRSRQS